MNRIPSENFTVDDVKRCVGMYKSRFTIIVHLFIFIYVFIFGFFFIASIVCILSVLPVNVSNVFVASSHFA